MPDHEAAHPTTYIRKDAKHPTFLLRYSHSVGSPKLVFFRHTMITNLTLDAIFKGSGPTISQAEDTS
jgi:hypothetical protein